MIRIIAPSQTRHATEFPHRDQLAPGFAALAFSPGRRSIRSDDVSGEESLVDGSRFDDLTRALGKQSTRRRTLAGIVGVVAGGLFVRTAGARTLTICHATGDAESPYESLEVSQAEFNLHARHGDFLRVECCVDSDCGSSEDPCSGVCQNGYCAPLPKPAGTSCELDETQAGVCDEQGVCTPSEICVAAPTCSSDSDCSGGDICINGGCFAPCTSPCSRDCADCICNFRTNTAGGRYCLDGGTYIGRCQTDADCPTGTLCSSFFSGSDYLCTQPCAQMR